MPSALGIGKKLWFLEGLGKELPAISRVINSKQIQLLSGVDVSLFDQAKTSLLCSCWDFSCRFELLGLNCSPWQKDSKRSHLFHFQCPTKMRGPRGFIGVALKGGTSLTWGSWCVTLSSFRFCS